jgi:hypothetical protein
MLARGCRRLLAASGDIARHLTSSARTLEGEIASSAEFVKKVSAISNLSPLYPTDFLKSTKIADMEGQPTPSKMKLSFVVPHKIIMSEAEVRAHNEET